MSDLEDMDIDEAVRALGALAKAAKGFAIALNEYTSALTDYFREYMDYLVAWGMGQIMRGDDIVKYSESERMN